MNLLDFIVLIATIVGIAVYGVWRTRGCHNLELYLKGEESMSWITIGLSVMATQASAITFMSTPGQGYEEGLDFVQFYFGVPLALVIIAAIFLPMYRRFNVYTAYEYLGRRFDAKTRLLGAGLFLLQRGLAAGITIYAPAIILSTMLGWRLDLTIVLAAVVAIIYTSVGGSEAVSLTQQYQMAVIFGGMIMAFIILLVKLPASFTDALTIAGGFGKMKAISFSFDIHKRYTLWSGLIAGLFLQLSYFGTDQSQVQRYISGSSLRASRLGLMFNGLFKIPMQFSILLLGVLVFVFYQLNAPPVFFNQPAWRGAVHKDTTGRAQAMENKFAALRTEESQAIRQWLAARHSGNNAAAAAARAQALAAHQQSENLRSDAKATLQAANPLSKGKDADYVFITFVLDHLPHGIIGLLIAAFFAAALSSKAAELNALASTTTVDFYSQIFNLDATSAHYVRATKWFTILWGLVALAFALYASVADNLIQAINIVGSLFYGVMLALFLVAFLLRWVGGTAVFWAALVAQFGVLYLHFFSNISYLWYNPIGCGACVLLSVLIQLFIGQQEQPEVAEPPVSAIHRSPGGGQ